MTSQRSHAASSITACACPPVHLQMHTVCLDIPRDAKIYLIKKDLRILRLIELATCCRCSFVIYFAYTRADRTCCISRLSYQDTSIICTAHCSRSADGQTPNCTSGHNVSRCCHKKDGLRAAGAGSLKYGGRDDDYRPYASY